MKAHPAAGSSGERDNVALVKGSLAALDAKDAAALLASLSAEAVFEELIDPQPFVGRDSVKTWVERWTTAIPDARTEITTTLGAGDAVLLETVVSGTLKGSFGRLAASNRAFTVHRAAIVTMKKRKIVCIAAFMNGKELAQATGQWPLATRE